MIRSAQYQAVADCCGVGLVVLWGVGLRTSQHRKDKVILSDQGGERREKEAKPEESGPRLRGGT